MAIMTKPSGVTLLGVRVGGKTYTACTETNGNIMGLIDGTTGVLAARWDYEAFGITTTTVEAAGPFGHELCPFRFSSKYRDVETGLYYYGYRYYSPEMGRWLSRDPIEEQGGINLYGMVGNDPVNRIDAAGLFAIYGHRVKNGGFVSMWLGNTPFSNVGFSASLDPNNAWGRLYGGIRPQMFIASQISVGGSGPSGNGSCNTITGCQSNGQSKEVAGKDVTTAAGTLMLYLKGCPGKWTINGKIHVRLTSSDKLAGITSSITVGDGAVSDSESMNGPADIKTQKDLRTVIKVETGKENEKHFFFRWEPALLIFAPSTGRATAGVKVEIESITRDGVRQKVFGYSKGENNFNFSGNDR
jgi:RHS repeat-associated protein